MDILHLRATVGPNYYSIVHPHLIIARVRGETSDVRELGKAALRLQEAAAAFAGTFIEVHPLAQPGTVHLVFETSTPEVGFAAILAAQRVVDGEEVDLAALREAWRNSRLLLSTQALVDEAASRGIPHLVLNDNSLVQLGYGCHQQRIQDTVTEYTSIIGVDLAANKLSSLELLRSMDMPVPRCRVIRRESQIDDALDDIGLPAVFKPPRGHQGQGVTTGVRDREAAIIAFAVARQVSEEVQIEEHVPGQDFRVLIVDNEFLAASLREPAQVVGDGKHTITALIEEVNRDSRRGYDHEKPLTRLELSPAAVRTLEQQGLSANSVPEAGQIVCLQTTANLSTGGTATDVTDEVHPENIALFERAAKFIGLDVAGLDVVAPDLRTPLRESGGMLIEMNAAPGFRMHLHPCSGLARNVCAPVVDKLFPPGRPSRIPILAVTGTNGKTTTTRLLAYLMQTVGRRVGFTSSDGIYLGGHRVQRGDCTDEFATWTVLKDPWVDTAVLEYPRGGIVRAGVGFDACDVGVVLNVMADHLGSRDIHTMEQMARVKAVIAQSVKVGGHAVLNADDERVLAMREGLRGEAAFFSLTPDNPHVAKSEYGAVLQDGRIVLRHGPWIYPLAKTVDIPLTLGGRALFMIQNVLAACLAAFCYGLRPQQIRHGLLTFDPGVAQTPGRMNYFYGEGFRVLVDYAHNPDSMRALAQYLDAGEADTSRVGVLGGTGDRLDEDIIELGRQGGRMFGRLIIREDRDNRGRAPGETAELVRRGALEANPEMACEVVLDPEQSVRYALSTAKPADLVVILGGDIADSLSVVRETCRPTR